MKSGKLSSLVNERKSSARFQFELWTLCVWLTEVLLICQIVFRSNGPHSYPGYLYIIPVLHPLPWVGALRIWKRTLAAESREQVYPSTEIRAAVLLMMPYAYIPLAFIECIFLALYR